MTPVIRAAALVLLLLPDFGPGRGSALAQSTPDQPVFSVLSPLGHLAAPAPTPLFGPGSYCPLFQYYDPNGAELTHTESIPTAVWGLRVTPPNAQCTVWTVNVRFEIGGPSPLKHDTLDITVREVTSPYTIIYTTRYTTRFGLNEGPMEIDPNPLPPYNHPIINPPRDFFVCLRLRGTGGHSVDWKFMTPSMYTNPPARAVKFTSPTSYIDASTAIGSSADWRTTVNLCLPLRIPVELSSFAGNADEGGVSLRWRTEAETNNAGFEVLRAGSTDGPWSLRGFVRGNGTTTRAAEYAFRDDVSDAASLPVLYYRLRQMDTDGSATLSPATAVYMEPVSPVLAVLSVFPQPHPAQSSGVLTARFSLPEDGYARLSVVDALGREVALVRDGVFTRGTHLATFLPAGLDGRAAPGAYLLRLQTGSAYTTRPFLITR